MKVGKRSYAFSTPSHIISTSTIAGPNEGNGPLKDYYRLILKDDKFGEKTFEMAERKMIKYVIGDALQRSALSASDIDMLLGGDLLNQIISASFTAREYEIPFVGLYGACSTMAESMALGALLIDSQNATKVCCTTGTHFSSVERQFRFPLELGTQRPPSGQWTVTGAACNILACDGRGPRITGATLGRVVDYGVTDANNMGAAMAPAAMDTLTAHLHDFGRKPDDYDLILTGDLGVLGGSILRDLMKEKDLPMGDNYFDCGTLVYNVDKSEFQGGSGCGCSAIVFNSYIYDRIVRGDYKKVLFMATGALLSPLSSQQGESIPGIAHAVVIEN